MIGKGHIQFAAARDLQTATINSSTVIALMNRQTIHLPPTLLHPNYTYTEKEPASSLPCYRARRLLKVLLSKLFIILDRRNHRTTCSGGRHTCPTGPTQDI